MLFITVAPTIILYETTRPLKGSQGDPYTEQTVFVRRGSEIYPDGIQERDLILKAKSTAMNKVAGISPTRLAAGVSGVVVFLFVLVLLRNDPNASAGARLIAATVASVISLFLASQLAAFAMQLSELRTAWPELRLLAKLVFLIILSLVSASLVLLVIYLVN